MRWAALRAGFEGAVLRPSAARPLLAAFLAGALLPLSYPPFYLLPVFYAASCLVMWLALENLRRGPWRFFALGWCFGFGQFFTGLLWIGEAFLVEAELFLWALPFAVTLLPAGLALFHGLAFALTGYLAGRFRLARLSVLLVLVLALMAGEFARGHILTGLPWNLPLMGWAGWLYLAQPVALIGPYGLSLFALASAALLVEAVSVAKARPKIQRYALALSAPVAAVAWSVFVLHGQPQVPPTDLKLAIVQPNLPQREKWDAALRDAHIDKTFALTKLGLQLAPDTALVIWPETALPAILDEGTGFADMLRARLPQERGPPYIMTGAIRREAALDGYAYYNSAQIWTGSGLLLAKSDKHHLVPFGEYLPLQALLEAIGFEQLTRLRGGYSAGARQARLTAAGLPLLAPLICYEAVFPHLAAGGERPAALVNLTNDGWFGTSFGPYQHLAQARLRAIEQGLPLLRAANTGVSAGFDARGRLIDALPLAKKGVLTMALPAALAPTFYARSGEAIFIVLWSLLALGVIIMWAIKRAPR